MIYPYGKCLPSDFKYTFLFDTGVPGISYLYYLIHLSHELFGEAQGGYDLLVVLYVLRGEGALFAVFEPLLQRLIPAYVLLPLSFWHVVKIARAVYIHSAVFVFGLYHLISSGGSAASRSGYFLSFSLLEPIRI